MGKKSLNGVWGCRTWRPWNNGVGFQFLKCSCGCDTIRISLPSTCLHWHVFPAVGWRQISKLGTNAIQQLQAGALNYRWWWLSCWGGRAIARDTNIWSRDMAPGTDRILWDDRWRVIMGCACSGIRWAPSGAEFCRVLFLSLGSVMIWFFFFFSSKAQASSTQFLNAIPSDYCFHLPSSHTTTSITYCSELSKTRCMETERRFAWEQYNRVLLQVLELEVQMGITKRWTPETQEYAETARYIYEWQYHQALNNLQCLVTQRLFELHRLNLTLGTRAQIPTGYMVKTLRSQSTCDSNMPSDQMLSTF